MRVSAPMIPMEMRKAIRPYSMTVVPDSYDETNRNIFHCTSSPYILLTLLFHGISAALSTMGLAIYGRAMLIQAVWLSSATTIARRVLGVEEIRSKCVKAHCAVEAKQFLPQPAPEVEFPKRARDGAATKQTTSCVLAHHDQGAAGGMFNQINVSNS